MKISVGNVLRVLVTAFIIGVVCSCQTSGKKNKSYDLSNPIGAIEAISNDVAEESEEWDREQWDVIADNLENAIKNLPTQLRDDEVSLVTATLSRMKVYGERHKRTASGLLEVINGYQQKNNASPAVATAQAAAAPAAAPAPPAKMETGIIKQEGGYTNVRKTPSLNGDIAIKLKDGSPILYNRYDASWCVVYNTAGQKLGYVHSSKIVADSPRAAAPVSATPFDWLATRYATQSDLEGLSATHLRVLRNAIYARHGRIFKDATLRSYFNREPWYNGYRSEIPSGELNKFEKYNIQFIQQYE